MTDSPTDLRSLVVEREFQHPPERIWRALTEPHLIAEWLMKNDFAAVPGHRFVLRGDWGSVDCEVIEAEPGKTLVYSWVAMGLDSIVTWRLSPTSRGTLLRMEQSGFQTDQEQAYQGANYGWRNFFGNLEQVLSQLE